ncbi:MAG: dprA [Propionibacteriaceae bacterium]|nr:dprA [Propionibacteriaceae bacterium]
MAPSTDRARRMALTCVVDGGDTVATELVTAASADEAWEAVTSGAFGEPLAERAARLDLAAVERRAVEMGARFVVPGDDEWPTGLDALRRCAPVQRRGGVPIGLWLRGPGHLAAMMERAVAVVGSRAATNYGSGVATDLAADLADQGVTIVSGGAFGIDAAAHRGALAVRGPTVAVLANGVDVPYPRGNGRLFDWIAKDHLLVSELAPGTTPTRVRFLARNRLIAAMAAGTLVVEAALRSGARNTASWALGCGRTLMAVPGPVHSTMSAAPHLMIREGQAILVTSAAEVLELISPVGDHLVMYPHGEERPTDYLEPTRLAVFEAVPARRPATSGEIALVAGVGISVCLAELAALEESGLIESEGSGWRLSSRSSRPRRAG